MTIGYRACVQIAEDEDFTLGLMREVLEGANFQLEAVTNVADAIERVGTFDPHTVITDLNFSVTGPSGVDYLQFVEKEQHWLARWC